MYIFKKSTVQLSKEKAWYNTDGQ